MLVFTGYIEKGVKMAFKVIDEKYLEKDWLHKGTKKVATKAQEAILGALKKTVGVFGGITDYTTVSLYFLLTGLSILFRSPVPKEWLALSKRVGGKRISKIIDESEKKTEKVESKRTFKVVDIDTKRPLKVLKVNKKG